MVRLIALVACLAAAFVIFYLGDRTPEPAPASAQASVFSAGRALEDIKAIAATPHPTGSAANYKARDHLMARMQGLGLSPQIQHAASVYIPARAPDVALGATVENIIGILPGKNRNLPALTLMAHYDSVPGSPGAADDAAGVATSLEVMRAIKAKGVPARDVMLLITDGEEPGLLGANAFFRQHPLASHVGFIINTEARGGGGRASMFQTGPDNAGAIALFRKTAHHPNSNSLLGFIYKMLPNDTDLTVSLGKGIPGLNIAFIGRQFDYHSPSSTVANLDKGALQSMGDQTLGPAVAMAFSETLPAKGPDLVYGNLPFGPMVAYPPLIGWVLLLIAVAGTAYGALAAMRAKAFSWRDLWKGVGAGVLVMAVAALLMHITRLATGGPVGFATPPELLARFPLFEVAMFASGLAAVLAIPAALARGKGRIVGPAIILVLTLALMALGGFDAAIVRLAAVLGVVGCALAFLLLGRVAAVGGVWTGMLVIGIGAALALQIAAPTAALVIAWPVTAAAIISALLAAGTRRGVLAWGIGIALIAIGVAWVGGFLHGFMQGLDLPELPALVVWLGALLLWPPAWPRTPSPNFWSYAPAITALIAGLGIAIFLNLTSPWSARYPEPATPFYLVDQNSGKAWRISFGEPHAWTRAVLTADGGAIGKQSFPTMGQPRPAAPAKAVPAPALGVTTVKGEDGTVTLTAPMAPDALTLNLELKVDTVVTDVRLNGAPVRLLGKPGKATRIAWAGPPTTVTVSFKPVGPGKLEVGYSETLHGWPAAAKPLPLPPSDVALFYTAGSTIVAGKLTQTW